MDCYIKEKSYSKTIPIQKAVADSLFSSGDTNNQHLSLSGLASSVWMFSNTALFVPTLKGLAYIRCM
jgi:hypothetical protein